MVKRGIKPYRKTLLPPHIKCHPMLKATIEVGGMSVPYFDMYQIMKSHEIS